MCENLAEFMHLMKFPEKVAEKEAEIFVYTEVYIVNHNRSILAARQNINISRVYSSFLRRVFVMISRESEFFLLKAM